MPEWTYHAVPTTAPEALSGFVSIEFCEAQPLYRLDDAGMLWKSACYIKVWDDGRVRVVAEDHLTPRQRRIVAGLGQEYWRDGPDRCRREKWRRIRRSKQRPVASRVSNFWVRPDEQSDKDKAAVAAITAGDIAVRAATTDFHDPVSERIGEAAL